MMPTIKTAKSWVFCFLWLGFAHAQEIQGRITENSAPIANAEVKLERFEDAKCVKAVTKVRRNMEEFERAQRCVREEATVRAGADGTFRFLKLQPGWYTVAARWNTQLAYPDGNQVQCRITNWAYSYYRGAEYNLVVEIPPTEIKPSKTVTLEFAIKAPLGKQGRCIRPDVTPSRIPGSL
jgi:hypothetical protein